MTHIRVQSLLLAVIAFAAIAMPTCAQAQWWSSREPVDYEDCAERVANNADAKQRDKQVAACESQFAGRRKPGGGYSYYDFMQDRHFDLAGPNPTPQEQREIDQHYTAFLDQNRRSIIAAAFARKQRELTEARLTAEAPATKPSGKPLAKPPSKSAPSAPLPVTAPQTDKPAPPRVAVASLTPPTAPAPVKPAALPAPRPSAAATAAPAEKPPAKPKRGACREQSFSCGLSRLGDSVSNLTKTIFSPPPKPKAGRS